MSTVNKAIILGHAGKDPEIRRTQDGRPIASLSIATGETWKDKATGERKEKTQWHRVVVFNEGLVKVIEQYVKKGSKLYVEGSMQTRSWKDTAGVERYVTEVVLGPFNSTLVLLDRKEGVPAAQSQDDYGGAGSGGKGAVAGELDDEIPF